MSLSLSKEDIINSIRDYLASQPDIIAAYLFGSLAKGTFRRGSDIDIAVLFAPGTRDKLAHFTRKLDLEIALTDMVHRSVQVVDLEEASPPLQHQVRKYGRLLVDKDKHYRVDFEVRSRRNYFDLQHFYRLQKEALFTKLGEFNG
ncbi:MAG TPA: nucleotidyltransferase domain-containing protein [Syntrophothermus lipocalidus]|nr:nucleotidyltransferase domain-containing protein [Syntrophothermus lipocalidus]